MLAVELLTAQTVFALSAASMPVSPTHGVATVGNDQDHMSAQKIKIKHCHVVVYSWTELVGIYTFKEVTCGPKVSTTPAPSCPRAIPARR